MRASVRCYACGAAGAHTSDSCGTCGASLVRLCACGKTVRFGARACAACGGQVTVRRFKPRWTRRRVVVRGALAACACLAVAAVAVSIVRSRACDPARRADAFAAYAAGDKVRALARISPLLEAAPTDVRGWLLRAACERDIGLGKEVFLSSVENAEKIDPTSLEVAQTHISLLAASGLHAEALAVADRALPLHATDTVLLGLHGRACLLAQPPRRLDAYRSFAAARGLGDASNETRILAAFAATLAFGEIPEPLRPVEVTRALAGAEPALAGAGSAVPVGLESAAARVCLTLGRGPTAAVLARRALERATAAGPDRVACRLLVAETALRTGDGAAADREFAAALAESPNSATAQAVVDACDRAGEYARAVGCISTAAGRGDASGGLSLVLARVAMGEGRWDDAERALTQALAADAASGEANLLLGDVRVAQHRPDDARESYRAAADVGLRVPAVTRAALLAISGDVTAAERRDALEEGIAAVRPLVERVDASADDWGQLARLDFAAGRNDVALEEIARATRQAPDRADLHLLEATIAGALGTRDGWSRAERSYAVAAALRPRFGNAAATGAQARCAVGDLTGAIAISTLALQREPARRDVLEIRARAHASLGSWKAAAFDYRELRRLGGAGDPQYAAALVEALCRGGAVSDAAELLDSLRDRIPERTRAELDALLAQFVPDRSVAGPSLVAAQRSFDAGDVDGAAATACAVLASHPGDPAATLVAVLALLEGRDSDLARCAEARRLRDAMALGTKQHLADLADGRLLLAEGAPVEAATRLARAVAAMPESAVAALLYGQALARSHREQEAVEILRKLLAAPRTSPVHRRQSSALLVAAAAAIPPGKRDDAIHGALLADRTNVVLADAWVRTLLERGEPERAAVWCGSILAVDSLPPADAVRFRDAAIRIALELGDVTRAERHLADVPAALQDTAGAWILRGAVRLARGDAVGALDAFERGLRLDPSCATGVLGVAESSLRLGRQDVAERIDAWLGAHDADEAVALGFARMLARRGHIDEALRRARTAREARPASETALRHLAAFLTEHGDPMAATVELTRAAERAPSERRTRLLLLAGRIRVRAGTEVQAALELARSQTGHEARTLESECLAELGDADAAELMAAREVERLPPSERALAARLRYVIGCASYHRGSADAAIAQFLACLDLDPLHAAAANNLAWIWVRNAATAGRGLDMARRATALTPLDPNVWDTRAACELAMHDGPAAEQSWRRAESLFAGQPRQRPALRGAAAMRLASYLASEKRSDEARAVARDVMQRAAGTPAAAKARDLLGAY